MSNNDDTGHLYDGYANGSVSGSSTGPGPATRGTAINHICIISLVPSVKKINIGNPGKLLGGGWFKPGNQQINANVVNDRSRAEPCGSGSVSGSTFLCLFSHL